MVLQAAEQPFKRVIGVELSSELHAVAQENLQAVSAKLRCQDVELLHADITTYRIPDHVSVVYAYNPVRGDLFEGGDERLDRLLRPQSAPDAPALRGKTRARPPVLIPCNTGAA